jgi:hypothetical protein
MAVVSTGLNSGRVEVRSGGRLFSAYDFDNAAGGTFLVSGAGSEAVVGRFLRNGGLLKIKHGARVMAGGLFHDPDASPLTRVSQGGRLELTQVGGSIPSGQLDLDDGTVTSNADLVVSDSGVLSGNGRLELLGFRLRLESGGVLLPGGLFEPGELELVGDLDFVGEIGIDLAGDLPGQFDLLSVEGDVDLAGLIEVNLVDPDGKGGEEPFDPVLGSHFDVLVANSIEDLGASFSLPTFQDERRFTSKIVNLAGQQVMRFSVVPEPSTGLLLLLGLAVLAARRRAPR